jgi:hypothetical protein
MKKLFGFVLIAAIWVAGAVKADVQTGMSIQRGWIAPEIYVSFDEASGKIEVFDGIIAAFNKEKPIEARLGNDKAISKSFGWSLFLVNGAGQRTKMQYQASLFKGTGKLHVTARPIGYRDVFSATGDCKPYKG